MAVSVKLDDDLKGRVQQFAKARRRSPHWVMHEAIRQYVEHEKARESFRQEAQASWAAYQETGRHVTGTEVRARLEILGIDTEAEPPECHE